MISIKRLLALSLILAANACSSVPKEPILGVNDLVDGDQVVAEGAERMKQTLKHAPDAIDLPYYMTEGSNGRVLVNKEEPIDYTDLSSNDDIDDFNIDINVENMDIRTFVQMFAQITGINMLVSDEVDGAVTIKLHDVPWTSAMDSVLKMKSLAQYVDKKANIIRIHSQEAIVQIESFERQRKADLQRTIELTQAQEPTYTELFKLFYTKPDTVKTILEEVLGIGDAASSGGEGSSSTNSTQITVDARVNQLIVKGRKEEIEMVNKLIRKIDTRTQQVFIEAFIVEVTDDFEEALGVRLGGDFSETFQDMDNKTFNVRATGLIGTAATNVSAGTNEATLSDLGVTAATSGLGLLLGLGSAADLKVELSAMEDEGLSKVISNPRIFTLDNQEATIFQGSEIPYETVSADGTQIQFKEAGLRLAVTPTVVGDGNLMMSISVNKDTADVSQENPPITKSEINTNLVTRDGSIVVIGGIFTQTKSDATAKVPLFGDIPGAGKLFRRDSTSNDRKELMVFIAPKVI